MSLYQQTRHLTSSNKIAFDLVFFLSQLFPQVELIPDFIWDVLMRLQDTTFLGVGD